jgi:hypothetical protein
LWRVARTRHTIIARKIYRSDDIPTGACAYTHKALHKDRAIPQVGKFRKKILKIFKVQIGISKFSSHAASTVMASSRPGGASS